MTTATRSITITDPVGIHARPASQLASTAAQSGCEVTIAKHAGEPGVNASSILSIMSLGINQGDTVQITVKGDDAEAVADHVVKAVKGE
ncbi:HPr family phosphocarrier protein [Bifidobacterium mongoliense]|jgi:phosphocarrier protein|uniref:HPr family phosphocarrier protein n=1 Tax=Bifidobacterium mongoliense TaxID=518643 RepID=UPI002648577C|nr:HPr family phosphocarrier protein [Bifidobacterium mongoliense]MDN6025478.1 HPr family phosphocarrier protein [Bifidobacterium mongoliense]MDN6051520.1 HPr family phosphocarrier protein [Bifidobacterium mongoliense]MDN6719828.1 HPr family phosphocarrier protein [Bifidobacterium mongoliense]